MGVGTRVSPCACVGLCAHVGALGVGVVALSMHDASGSKPCMTASRPSAATALLQAPIILAGIITMASSLAFQDPVLGP